MLQERRPQCITNDTEDSTAKENIPPPLNYDNHDKVTRHSSGAGLMTRSTFAFYIQVGQQSSSSTNNPFEVSEKVKPCGDNTLPAALTGKPCSATLLKRKRKSNISHKRSSDPFLEGSIAFRVKRNRRGRQKCKAAKEIVENQAPTQTYVSLKQEEPIQESSNWTAGMEEEEKNAPNFKHPQGVLQPSKDDTSLQQLEDLPAIDQDPCSDVQGGQMIRNSAPMNPFSQQSGLDEVNSVEPISSYRKLQSDAPLAARNHPQQLFSCEERGLPLRLKITGTNSCIQSIPMQSTPKEEGLKEDSSSSNKENVEVNVSPMQVSKPENEKGANKQMAPSSRRRQQNCQIPKQNCASQPGYRQHTNRLRRLRIEKAKRSRPPTGADVAPVDASMHEGLEQPQQAGLKLTSHASEEPIQMQTLFSDFDVPMPHQTLNENNQQSQIVPHSYLHSFKSEQFPVDSVTPAGLSPRQQYSMMNSESHFGEENVSIQGDNDDMVMSRKAQQRITNQDYSKKLDYLFDVMRVESYDKVTYDLCRDLLDYHRQQAKTDMKNLSLVGKYAGTGVVNFSREVINCFHNQK